ncbi:MAG: lytic transglycosylase domain-containing protein [Clostridia bacterium]|nr:lytic transglycosylase domain-containing protein [Clostridia bacterium]
MFFVSFPLRWEAEVCRSCKEFGTDAPLVFAVIREESGFKAESISPKGAVGLMQLTPSTAEYVASELLKEPAGDISDADTNIRYGVAYLSYLLAKFKDESVSLAAYNAGEGNVAKWLSDKNYSSDGKTLAVIPFRETDEYVKRVLRSRKIYEFILNGAH